MIPSMIALGLALGRWWRFALVLGTVGWPALLIARGDLAAAGALPAALIAFLNVASAVCLVQASLLGYRAMRNRAERLTRGGI